MKSSLACLAVAVVAFAPVGCGREHEEYITGQGQAERDLAGGTPKIAFVDGADVPAFWEYTSLLQRHYHVGWCSCSLPADPRAAEAWVRGYNEVALPAIERQIGASVLKQTMGEALKLHANAMGDHRTSLTNHSAGGANKETRGAAH